MNTTLKSLALMLALLAAAPALAQNRKMTPEEKATCAQDCKDAYDECVKACKKAGKAKTGTSNCAQACGVVTTTCNADCASGVESGDDDGHEH
jgi:hypothetical protein